MAIARVRPGDVLGGKYRVERVLGAGGMGVVVAAKHLELGQRVALKLMLEESARDPEQSERFLREARAAVQLRSLHTARVLDVGRLGDGEPFMVMEYLEGRDLDAELQAVGPMPPPVAVEYMLQAAEALAEAHGLGMIHRDIKLKNMFLTRGVDGRPLVKVLDFGLAKLAQGDYDVSLTTQDSTFGSPQYMSPEQMRSAKNVDARTDVWSMGVCLYELLTGRLPFDAPTAPEICAMVLKDAVPRPSAILKGIPSDLEAVVLRCLDKDPARRFQSVADLAVALERFAPEHGSARRILHVMRTAQQSDAALAGNAIAFEAPGKTLNAWDSTSSPTRRMTTSPGNQNLGVKIGLGVAALVLSILGAVVVVAWKKPKPQPLVSESSAPEATATAAPSDTQPLAVPLVSSVAEGPNDSGDAPEAAGAGSLQPPAKKTRPARPLPSARTKAPPSTTTSAPNPRRSDSDHL